MSGLFSLLSLGANSLQAAQYAQASVGNNAANATTPGYSRRRPTVAEGQAITLPVGVIGTGVTVAGLQRLRDTLLDAQWRLDSNDFQYAKAQVPLLNQVGQLLSPPDDNPLSHAVSGFFAALGDLSSRPEDMAARSVVLGRAQEVANAFQTVQSQLTALESNTFSTIGDRVTEANQVASQIAQLNAQQAVRANDPSLADARDKLIDRLAELIGVHTTTRADGTVQVMVDGSGIQIVDGSNAATVGVTGVATSGVVGLTVGGNALGAAGGEIGGLLNFRNSPSTGVPYALSTLDQLAQGVIAAVNEIHSAGSGLSLYQSITGSTVVANPALPLNAAGLWLTPQAGTLRIGVFDAAGNMVSTSTLAINPAVDTLNSLAANIGGLPNLTATVTAGGQLQIAATNPANFVAFGPDTSNTMAALGVNGIFTGSDARTIGVDQSLVGNPRLVGAAQADFTAGVISAGDNRNAQALAALESALFMTGKTQTFAQFLGGFGAQVGSATSVTSATSDTLEVAVQGTDAQRQQTSGVNVDEEVADMTKYQNTYAASAHFIKTIDQMLQSLMDILA